MKFQILFNLNQFLYTTNEFDCTYWKMFQYKRQTANRSCLDNLLDTKQENGQ